MHITRRNFILAAAAGAVNYAVTPVASGGEVYDPDGGDPPSTILIPTGTVPWKFRAKNRWALHDTEQTTLPSPSDLRSWSWSFRILRPHDMVVLDASIRHVETRSFLCTRAIRRRGLAQPRLVINFPPQHIAEDAEVLNAIGADGRLPPMQGTLPLRAILSGRSRLVFVLPLSLEDCWQDVSLRWLLDWRRLTLRRPPIKVTGPVAPEETSIEFPTGMILSPQAGGFFDQPTEASDQYECDEFRGRVVELWQTRWRAWPGISHPTVRAARSVDVVGDNGLTFPTPEQRSAIIRNNRTATQPPIKVEELGLSSLGASARLRGYWPDFDITCRPTPQRVDEAAEEPTTAVEAWQHQSHVGRDGVAQVVVPGFLFPFGHAASLIRVHRRMLRRNRHSAANDPTEVAVVNKYGYIHIKQPDLRYPFPASIPPDVSQQFGRAMGFDGIEFRKTNTSFLRFPGPPDETNPGHDLDMFWVVAANENRPFAFDAIATDRASKSHPVQLFAIWVSVAWLACDRYDPAKLLELYAKPWPGGGSRRAEFGGRRVSFVPPPPDTAIPTEFVEWSADFSDGNNNSRFPKDWLTNKTPNKFFPRVHQAYVRLESATSASGLAAAPEAITYEVEYEAAGLRPERLDIWAEIERTSPPEFDPARGGGLAIAEPEYNRISRLRGPYRLPVLPLDERRLLAASGAQVGFDPKTFFSAASKLLGGIGLGEVVAEIEDALDDITRIPRAVAQEVAGYLATLDQIRKQAQPLLDLIRQIIDGDDAVKILAGEIRKQVLGEIENVLGTEWDNFIRDFVRSKLPDAKAFLNDLQAKIFADAAMAPIDEVLTHAVEVAIQAEVVYETLRRSDVAADIRFFFNDPTQAKLFVVLEKRFDQALPPAKRQAAKDALASYLRDKVRDTPWYQEFQQFSVSAQGIRERVIAEARDQGHNAAVEFDKLREIVDRELDTAINQITQGIATVMAPLSEVPVYLIPSLQRTAAQIDSIFEILRNPDEHILELPDRIQALISELESYREAKTLIKSTRTLPDGQARLVNAGERAKSALGGVIDRFDKTWLDARKNVKTAASTLNVTQVADVAQEFIAVDDLLSAFEKQAHDKFTAVRNHAETKIDDLLLRFRTGLPQWFIDLDRRIAEAHAFLSELLAQAKAVFELLRRAFDALPQELSLSYDFSPKLQDAPAGKPFFRASTDAGGDATFDLHASVRKSLRRPADPPLLTVRGSLQNFTINLIPSAKFLSIEFDKLDFISINGAKPKFEPKIRNVKFAEALEFIKNLARALSPDNGPFLELDGLLIRSGFRFQLPAITSGAFNLAGLAIEAKVLLPLDGKETRVGFALSSEERPFLITVGILGGGGYFGLQLSPRRVESIDGLFQFGAAAFFEITGASGHAQILAFVSFTISADRELVRGGLRVDGQLRVIGLVNMSLTIELSLGYEKTDGQAKLVGEAKFKLEIEFCFFSVHVTLTCRRELEGGNAGGGAEKRTFGSDEKSPVSPLLQDADNQLGKAYSIARSAWINHFDDYYESTH